MQQFLDSSQYIDWRHPAIISQAAELAIACRSDEKIAKRCFEFARDAVKYGRNYGMNPAIPSSMAS